MKIYKGTEIMNVIDIMDEIIYKSSLCSVFDNDEHHYRELVEDFPELLNGMICYMADDCKSYMFISTDYNDYSICVAMWASIDNNVSFKQTLQYFNALRDLYKGMTNKVSIRANCRTTTSLPVINKLDGRRGIKVTYRSPECYGFVDIVMECEI